MAEKLVSASRVVVARFRRQRPLRAGSLIVTVLGDSIAPRGGAITLGSLIRLAQPFGVTERLVRTSVGRLAQDKWLESQRSGRQSEYRLTEEGRTRFAEATQRIYADSPRDWDGSWTLLWLPETARAHRQRIRDELQWLGFGQVSAGMFAHPTRSIDETRARLAKLNGSEVIVLLRGTDANKRGNHELVKAGWDLSDLGRRYSQFVASFTPVLEGAVEQRDALAANGTGRFHESDAIPRAGSAGPGSKPRPRRAGASSGEVKRSTGGGESLSWETAFVVRTLLIHEYRKIHLRDPLLPRALLPDDWVGTQAYELCRDLYRLLFQSAEQHVAQFAETLAGPLAPVSQATLRRFGGIHAE